MAYSVDFRRHVLAVRRREGLSFEQTARQFGVGRASVTRWSKSVERKPVVRAKRKIDLDALRADVRDHPDAYQYERAARFGVTQNAIFKALRQIGVTYKESPAPSEGGRRRAAALSRDDRGA